MAVVRTAISLDRATFRAVDALAAKTHRSRSEIFVRAVREFIARQENRALLARLNDVYQDRPTNAESTMGRAAKRKTAHVIDEW